MDQTRIDSVREQNARQRASLAELDLMVTVPREPTKQQWGGLARDIVMWLETEPPHHGSKLHQHLRALGEEIPEWLTREIPDTSEVPPKGTIAAVIYKAMIAAYKP